MVSAGPGVTNSVSAVTTAHFNGAPVVVLGGRAPDYRWGAGSLQEIDHPPLLAPVTKRAWTEHATAQLAGSVDEAFRLAATPHRGPVFLDVSLEALYDQAAPPAWPDGTGAGRGLAGGRRPGSWCGQRRRRAAARPRGRPGAGIRGMAGRRRGRGPGLRRSLVAVGHRDGQGRGILRPASAACDPGALGGLPGGGPGRGGRYAAGLRLGYGQFGAGNQEAPVVHWWTAPGRSPPTARWRPRPPAT